MNPGIQIREAEPTDRAAIRALAIDNRMFQPDDMGDFDRTLDGAFDGTLDDHRWLVAIDDTDHIIGAAYYAPEPFADRLWNLYFLASRPDGHRSGAGTALVQRVEHDLQRQGEAAARILIVETSSLDAYRPARTFYARAGFREEARITDFYGPGDDKITFWRSLLA